MEANLRLEQASEINCDLKYRNSIGKFLYVSTGTRPDIAFGINFLSRFQGCYSQTHYKYAMRILKYSVKTKNLKLTYNNELSNVNLDCMVDSDFAGDVVNRKSTTGFVVRAFGNVVFWKS